MTKHVRHALKSIKSSKYFKKYNFALHFACKAAFLHIPNGLHKQRFRMVDAM